MNPRPDPAILNGSEMEMRPSEEQTTMTIDEESLDMEIDQGAEDPPPTLRSSSDLALSGSIHDTLSDGDTGSSLALAMDGDFKKRRSSTIKLQPRAPQSHLKPPQFVPRRHSGLSRISRKTDIAKNAAEELAKKMHPIVLKMTIHTDQDIRTSFVISNDQIHCGIGRNPSNAISIPADKYLADIDHAIISYVVHPIHGPGYYITPGATETNGTYIRLSPCSTDDVAAKSQWPLEVGCQFRAGKSDFEVLSTGPASMQLGVLTGKLAGKVFTINATGATIGRSADNTIHTGDGELSRRHAAIWYDGSKFYGQDLGSTNGTFMKLCGAYEHPYRLEIGDHILVSQTCLSVNRFDFGAYENMGARKQMEDAHSTIQ
ncbi:unnamed protein product, partial [Aphanomyces euteiches]